MIIAKFINSTSVLAAKRQVLARCTTLTMDRDNEIIVPSGVRTARYMQNPVALAYHKPEWPVARAISVDVRPDCLDALFQFPPVGVSEKADEVYGLIQAEIINAVSVGVIPLKTAPMDPAQPRNGPKKYLESELLEISFVSCPANPEALIIARSARGIGVVSAGALARRLRVVEAMKASAPRINPEQARRIRVIRALELANPDDSARAQRRRTVQAYEVAAR